MNHISPTSSDNSASNIHPDRLFCPLNRETIKKVGMLACGHIFEESRIIDHFTSTYPDKKCSLCSQLTYILPETEVIRKQLEESQRLLELAEQRSSLQNACDQLNSSAVAEEGKNGDRSQARIEVFRNPVVQLEVNGDKNLLSLLRITPTAYRKYEEDGKERTKETHFKVIDGRPLSRLLLTARINPDPSRPTKINIKLEPVQQRQRRRIPMLVVGIILVMAATYFGARNISCFDL